MRKAILAALALTPLVLHARRIRLHRLKPPLSLALPHLRSQPQATARLRRRFASPQESSPLSLFTRLMCLSIAVPRLITVVPERSLSA